MREKKICMHSASLIVSFESITDLTKKIKKFKSISCVQEPISGGKLYLMDLWLKYEKWGK